MGQDLRQPIFHDTGLVDAPRFPRFVGDTVQGLHRMRDSCQTNPFRVVLTHPCSRLKQPNERRSFFNWITLTAYQTSRTTATVFPEALHSYPRFSYFSVFTILHFSVQFSIGISHRIARAPCNTEYGTKQFISSSTAPMPRTALESGKGAWYNTEQVRYYRINPNTPFR